MTQKEPLVSIMIPNYNYSQYLDECIQSAINQTYDNLEIIILDNKSTDDSMQIIRKYNDSRIRIGINSYNIFNNNYKILSDCLIDGKYAMTLCSDDAIEPDFIKMAVDYMEKYPNVAYVHGERSFIEPDGTEHLLSPFFKCSFRAEGVNMMPIYMVTTVAHASQGVFRLSSFRNIHGYDIEVDHMNLDRSLWFFMSYQNE